MEEAVIERDKGSSELDVKLEEGCFENPEHSEQALKHSSHVWIKEEPSIKEEPLDERDMEVNEASDLVGLHFQDEKSAAAKTEHDSARSEVTRRSTEQNCAMEHSKGAKPTARLTSQTRSMILNVYNYFRKKDERESEMDVQEKTAAATGVSSKSVSRIKKQGKEGRIKSPPPRISVSKVMAGLDKFGEESIRRELLSFYERGELPTVESLLLKIKKPPINFSGSHSSLRRMLGKVGFRCKRVQGGKYLLLERNEIVAMRNKYLREMNKNRRSLNPRPEIYLGETWVNQNERVGKCWTLKDGSVVPRLNTKLKPNEGACFIILHAGGEDGFVPGGMLMFRLKTGEDYRVSMNSERFRSWFSNHLLPNVSQNSLIVMDSARYHSKLLNKAPALSSRKSEILAWLTENNIKHEPKHCKAELLQIIAQHKDKQVYEIDKMAHENGHEVLRLPPYHRHLNPIELIWTQIKSEVKKEQSNSNQSLKKLEEILKSAIDRVSKENWKKCMIHTREVEEECMKKDSAVEDLVENFVFVLNDDESSSEDED